MLSISTPAHEVFDRSIDVQISRIRRKIETDTRNPEMIRTVRNAVKYGSRARVTLDVHGGRVNITIEDDGPGVPPSLIPKLYLPFFRIEASRNRATGGFGLGLPSARSIIRNHGGELTLENRQPHGLRAIVVLPHVSV